MDRSTLAFLVDVQIRSVRSWLSDQQYVEVFVPHLGRHLSIPWTKAIDFKGQETGSPTGTLIVSGSNYLVDALGSIDRVYTSILSFRADFSAAPASQESSSWLFEFHLIQAAGHGTINDALAAHGGLLRAVATAALDSKHVPSDREDVAQKLIAGAERISYVECCKLAGIGPDKDLDQEAARKILRQIGGRPFFATNPSPEVEPRYAMFNRRTEDGSKLLKYDLILPGAGECGAGGEYECRRDVLERQVKSSSHFKEMIRLGGDPHQLDGYIEALSKDEEPRFWFNLGFERLTQCFTGSAYIEESALFPVSSRSWKT